MALLASTGIIDKSSMIRYDLIVTIVSLLILAKNKDTYDHKG